MQYRTACALTLVLAIFLSSLGLTVSVQAQTSPASPEIEYDHFMIYQGDDGDTICREATPIEREQLEKVRPKNLRQINHTGMNALAESTSDNAGPNLTIILRATANLESAPLAKAAFIRAAANWEAVVNSPVTIYLDADYGSTNFGQAWGAGVLGSTSSPSMTSSFSTVRSMLINGANGTPKQNVYNALPTGAVPTDVGNVSTVSVSHSIARAIGLLSATAEPTDSPARIGFNSSFNFDFDPSDGITSGQTDFEAVATHEIGHALGFTSRSGTTSDNKSPAMWDLYRFRSGMTDSSFSTAQRIMTFGGPTANSQYYFVPGNPEVGLSDGGPSGSMDNNADGNQSSHWRNAALNGGVFAGYIGIMDPRIPGGIRRQITPADTKALDIFGYNSTIVAPTPPPNDNFSAAQVISDCAGTTTGTNLGATKETNEPNHAPDNNGGSRSIWYQWTAPSSGSAQVTTAGSTFDTVLAVYTGSAVGSLTLVSRNDDVDPGVMLTSSVQFQAVAGTTYRIAVDGYNNSNSGGDVGEVTFNWALACSSSWQPTGLNPGQVQLKSWTIDGQTSIYAKLLFPHAGYRVVSWGSPFQTQSNGFAVSSTVEQWSGFSAQVLTSTAQIYNLGTLAPGDYFFTFQTSGQSVTTINFSVTGQPPPSNPIDDAAQFVTWQYRDFLRREPDAPGLAHWTNEITQCSDPAKRLPGESQGLCIARKRANTSAAFFMSPEFQTTGYFVLRVYRGSLGRMPRFGGGTTSQSEFTRDAATVASGIVVNDQLSPTVINNNKQAFVNEFVNRSEFRAIYEGLNDTQYVDKLFQTTGVTPSSADRNALIAEAGTAGGRASVLFKVVDGTTTINSDGHLQFNTTYGKAFYDAQFNAAFVQIEYFGYLLRDPDDAGYAFWLGKLNQFGNWVDAQMVLAFISSPEYRSRFGAP
ncbi:MAG TPA: NF038122 family metalloprotease [Pyrinomonadaceae bacterium]|nr:NF038122 family metalloprotease [Pyrinomonadaceae bacterium]